MATPDIWTMNGVAWTEEDEQDSAELIQEIIDHETFDITRAVQYNARIIAWQRGHATPIGY
jgi:hypothetical protein